MNRFWFAGLTLATAFAFLGAAAAADVKAPGPLGLPSVETLKEKLSLTEAQTKKVETIYDEYSVKAKEVDEKRDARKASDLRHEIVGKIKEVCTDDQKKKLDQVVAESGK